MNEETRNAKDYARPVPPRWWLRKRSYTLFMLRELTAVFVAGYALFLLALLYRAYQGPQSFSGFVQGLSSPISLVLHLIALAMAVYHSITWFKLTPKVRIVWLECAPVNPSH